MKIDNYKLDQKVIGLVIIVCSMIIAFGVFGRKMFINSSTPVYLAEASVIQDDKILTEGNIELSKVILNIRDISCSGCISTIKDSLNEFAGIKDILVDIRSGRAEIYFDSDSSEDVKLYAEAITTAGYPAEVIKIMSPDEIKEENTRADAKSQYYIASVGGWDISRSDFETELDVIKKKYSSIYGESIFSSTQGETLLENLKYQIVSRLLDEGVIMQEIGKAGFKVDDETIEYEYQAHLKKMGKNQQEFENDLSMIGYDLKYFRGKFARQVSINRYINDNIIADVSNPVEKQNLLTSWFNNSKLLAEVVYYDRDIENLILTQSASSSCGGQN